MPLSSMRAGAHGRCGLSVLRTPLAIGLISALAACHGAETMRSVATVRVGPFVWKSGGISLLTRASTDPAWTVTSAARINRSGQILATADHADGRKGQWVILTPKVE
jgi:hypothetical protein